MWKEILKIIRRAIVVVGWIVIVFAFFTIVDYFAIGSQYSNTYNAALIDKYERIQSVDSPKVILIGNSNLAFGIDSALLEKELGMPVVNMGFLGSIGNEFHEKMIYENVGEGDIVVIAHTSYADDDSIGYIPAVWITMDCNRELYKLLRPKDVIYALPGYPNYLRNAYILKLTGRGNADTGDSYSRNAFNEYGDIVVRKAESQMNTEFFFKDNQVQLSGINDICISRLNELNEYVSSYGATMVVAAYPIAYGEYSEYDAEDVITFQEALDDGLDCDVISDFTDYMYPYEYFFDQAYHLTEDAAEIRTEQLAKDIISAGLVLK